MNKRILISEEEKRDILKMHNKAKSYYMLKEDEMSEPGSDPVWPIVKELIDAKTQNWFGGTQEQKFANAIRKIKNFDTLLKVEEGLKGKGIIVSYLPEFIDEEFDHEDSDDQYWLKEIDKHFKSIGLPTNFSGGNFSRIYDQGQDLAEL